MKRVLVVVMIMVLVLGWSAAPAKATSPQQPFYVEKHCGPPNPAGTCTIVYADSPLEFLVGATIEYTDHAKFMNEAGVIHNAASILITTTDGDSTTGHVSWSLINGEFFGSITIQPGTGQLAGFHASGKIGVITWPVHFSFTGTYFYTP